MMPTEREPTEVSLGRPRYIPTYTLLPWRVGRGSLRLRHWTNHWGLREFESQSLNAIASASIHCCCMLYSRTIVPRKLADDFRFALFLKAEHFTAAAAETLVERNELSITSMLLLVVLMMMLMITLVEMMLLCGLMPAGKLLTISLTELIHSLRQTCY